MSLSLLPYGDRAWLIETPGDPIALARWLRAQDWPSECEVVAGARTCLLRFAGRAPRRGLIADTLDAATSLPDAQAAEQGAVVLPVRYDGEDLQGVADRSGLTPGEVVELHAAATYRVAFMGFAPGFAYLTGLPERLQLPRRDVPRVRVPAGAVAIADHYSAIYPRESPGGWHLLGTCHEWLFDPDRPAPSRLRNGMRVRFEAVP